MKSISQDCLATMTISSRKKVVSFEKLSKGFEANILTLLFFFIFTTTAFSNDTLSQTENNFRYSVSTTKKSSISSFFAPEAPRWTNVPDIDLYVREKIKWDDYRTASKISDVMLFGAVLPSIVWTPALLRNYSKMLLLNVEVFTVNALITSIVKLIAARERPGIAFGSYSVAELKSDSYQSFFSGHASIAYSLSTTAAMILADSYRKNSALIWTGALSIATFTSYLRIAGDRHYFTDVVVGAVVGMAIGYIIPYLQKDDLFPENGNKAKNYSFNICLPF